MWRAMDMGKLDFHVPAKKSLTYKCMSPKGLRPVEDKTTFVGLGLHPCNWEEKVSRWVLIWEDGSS